MSYNEGGYNFEDLLLEQNPSWIKKDKKMRIFWAKDHGYENYFHFIHSHRDNIPGLPIATKSLSLEKYDYTNTKHGDVEAKSYVVQTLLSKSGIVLSEPLGKVSDGGVKLYEYYNSASEWNEDMIKLLDDVKNGSKSWIIDEITKNLNDIYVYNHDYSILYVPKEHLEVFWHMTKGKYYRILLKCRIKEQYRYMYKNNKMGKLLI